MAVWHGDSAVAEVTVLVEVVALVAVVVLSVDAKGVVLPIGANGIVLFTATSGVVLSIGANGVVMFVDGVVSFGCVPSPTSPVILGAPPRVCASPCSLRSRARKAPAQSRLKESGRATHRDVLEFRLGTM